MKIKKRQRGFLYLRKIKLKFCQFIRDARRVWGLWKRSRDRAQRYVPCGWVSAPLWSHGLRLARVSVSCIRELRRGDIHEARVVRAAVGVESG